MQGNVYGPRPVIDSWSAMDWSQAMLVALSASPKRCVAWICDLSSALRAPSRRDADRYAYSSVELSVVWC